jgi:phosphatidylglycerol:prolipoprotein diacylglycerol transferase
MDTASDYLGGIRGTFGADARQCRRSATRAAQEFTMPPIHMTIDPILAEIGSLQIGWHGIFTALALLAGLWLGFKRAAQLGLDVDAMAAGMGWVIFGAVIGARLFHVMDHLTYYAEHPLEIVMVWQGGIAVYGGFIGGVLAGVVAARFYKVPIWPALDAAAPGMLLGQAVGRIGCFINGDAWGAPNLTCSLCGSVVYWNQHDLIPPDLIGVPTYPYPLYEMGAVLVLLAVLWVWRDRLGSNGTMFLVATIGYAVIRFGLTAFRQETIIALGLQEAQVIALITAILAVGALAFRMVRARSSALVTS